MDEYEGIDEDPGDLSSMENPDALVALRDAT